MRERYVTDPAGMRWIVAPALPLGVPRYRGFRFGVRPRDPAAPARRKRTRAGSSRSGGWTIPLPRLRPGRYRGDPSGGGTASGERGGTASGERAHASRGGTGSGARGGGAVGALGGLGALIYTVGKWVLIVAGIVAAVLLTVFVLLPGLAWLIQLAAAGIARPWHAVTGRPWRVLAREDRDAPRELGWEVAGRDDPARVVDEVAEALARGSAPAPAGAIAIAPTP